MCVIDNIIKKKENAAIVYEDRDWIAFLDHRPLFLGHTLLAPKRHVETLYELDEPLLFSLFAMTQKIGKAVEKGMGAEGSFIAMNNIVSQSIPHLHVHIVPRNKGDGLKGFFWPRTKYENDEQRDKVKEQIKRHL
ncbi:HIT family protein [Legionella londiniensis]|uniref:Histidine triad (HIT) protein n=1 Tax=Legionella londiniensis TaxID=45068 RepID=A0A0W0VQZ2_9GAMM|nr:HIT family protein [Legionella londiniensis]KTD22556.1 Histidine triad (HIT) protein [Legionella londiniensis]STX92487.1 Histidine triad (HIT) protein [Legionella londiniensis]